eukprot:scaffold7337_cov220-Pinguiococcus_pyrenoidosus.AAC.7
MRRTCAALQADGPQADMHLELASERRLKCKARNEKCHCDGGSGGMFQSLALLFWDTEEDWSAEYLLLESPAMRHLCAAAVSKSFRSEVATVWDASKLTRFTTAEASSARSRAVTSSSRSISSTRLPQYFSTKGPPRRVK